MAAFSWPTGLFQYIFFFIASISSLLALKFLASRNWSNKKLNLPPNPPRLPIIGNLHQLTSMPHLSLHRLAQQLGPIIFLQLGEVPTVVVSSARLVKEVMKTHDLAAANRPQLYAAKYLFYNCTNIVFSPYNSYWRYIRKIATLELFSAKRVHSYGSVRDQEVARLIQRIAENCPGKATNLSKVLGLYANDVLCRVVFGRDFSAGGEYYRHGFQKMLEQYQDLLGGFSIGDFFPSLEFIHHLTGMKSRLMDTFERFDKFFDEVIDEHLNPNRARKGENKDLLDVLLDIQKESAEMPLTLDNVKAIMLDMFAAGTDTTFITLDWGMTELIMNSKVMERAQDEVRNVIGHRTVVLESDIPKLHYLKAVIKEIFRKHPPVPVLVPRETIEDISIDGYHIPAKTRIFINAWAIGRETESWKDPEKFEPERFMGSSIDYKGQNFELIPFGSGRRSCPAMALGVATVELALAQILHSFDWELPPGTKAEDLDLSEAFGISMHKRADLVALAKPYFINNNAATDGWS